MLNSERSPVNPAAMVATSVRCSGVSCVKPTPGWSIPIVEPDVTHVIGLVVPHREPMTPMTAALVAEAQKVALTLDRPS
jgi:hypothetical protein